MIAKVDGVMNGISVIGDMVGVTMYYGPGAGGDATASAVVADIIDIARSLNASKMLGFDKSLQNNELKLKNIDEIESEYYVRMSVVDKPGVLSKITSIFGAFNISIGTFLQTPETESESLASLLFCTHTCKELDIKNALAKIEELDFVRKKPVMIRIEN
jgi:homoserine dehydrogenase